MEFEIQSRKTPEINLSALIDVAFILVIFVVLAANFDRIQELKVALPDAKAQAHKDPKALVVTVPPKGPFEIDGVRVAEAEVEAVLREKRAQFESVRLMADQAASMQRAVKVLSGAQAAGFAAIGIATKGDGTP